MERKVKQCIHNMSGICSHGKYQNFPCVGKCQYYYGLTQDMVDSWNKKGFIAINDDILGRETEMQEKSFQIKVSSSRNLDELALRVFQDELFLFDQYLKSLDLTEEEYVRLYEVAYKHCT